MEAPDVPLSGCSASSSRSLIFTMHLMISRRWNMSYSLTSRPRTIHSLNSRSSTMHVTQSWLALSPPPCPLPCSKWRDASSSRSRQNNDHYSTLEFSILNHHSPELSPSPPGKLISSASNTAPTAPVAVATLLAILPRQRAMARHLLLCKQLQRRVHHPTPASTLR